jgi:acyl-CoA synthetase (AMP-forming)/AMP-acid ligase II/acyl carrier protein
MPLLLDTSDNWVSLLRDRAARQPNRLGYRFLKDGEADEVTLTYGALDRRARAVGAMLARRFAPGSRLLLLYPPGLDFVTALTATWYAGMAGVPCPLPKPNKPGRTRAAEESLPTIAADCKADAALTIARFAPVCASALGNAAKATTVVTTDDVAQDDAAADAWVAPATKPGDIAILQYTSGSTRTPRGVMLTHANLLHNSSVICQAFGHHENSRGVIWLPHYHDMGLIGGILQTLYTGLEVTLMAPAAFVQKPIRWLRAITRYGGTTSGGPNSAYELCLRAIPPGDREGLNLSTWGLAFNGAEPVRARTLQQFTEAFAPHGFRGKSFYPCYGLAEASLMITGGQKGTLPRVRVEANSAAGPMVSCATPRACEDLLVVDPAMRAACAPGATGEVWTRGQSIGAGYYGDERATNETFRATLANDPTGRTFLRTGDLGLLDDTGELFVTGRLKDLIVIGGANHYPNDIEWTAQHAHPSLQVDGGAAFTADSGDEIERLFLVQEVAREHEKSIEADPAPVLAAIRREVGHVHGIRPAGIALLPAGSLLRTSSGKVRRSACRTAYLAGTLATIATWNEADEPGDAQCATEGAAMSNPAELSPEAMELYTWMAAQLAAAAQVNVRDVKPDQPLVRYGLDSPDAISLALTFEEALGVEMPATLFWDYPTLGALAEYIWREHRVTAPKTKLT